MDGLYQPLEANERGHLWSQQLGLFLGVYNQQLRFFTPEGQLIPTPVEAAEQEEQKAVQERQRADQEQQRSEKLAAKLRELGIDPADL